MDEHVSSMRRALQYVRATSKLLRNCSFRLDATGAPTDLLKLRQQAIPPQSKEWKLDEIETENDCQSVSSKYLLTNIPCLIRCNHLRQSCFGHVDSLWVEDDSIKRTNSSGFKETGKINRRWFLEVLGESFSVPVRVQQQGSNSMLDTDGRCEECQTKNMSIESYFDILDKSEQMPTAGDSFYLKDWHLQQYLFRERPNRMPLYTVPDCFYHDMLNDFLERFTSGDYKFVYFGPKGSNTGLHSDVLNSFSWSYNVSGIKEWTFYIPGGRDEKAVVLQQTGELMFVPATWKHSVVNLTETLSINHNWITMANLDLAWDCINADRIAVDNELLGWNITDLSARENMLRGSCGLDVTAFVLMIAFRMTQILSLHVASEYDNKGDGDDDYYELTYDESFELIRCHHVLNTILIDDAVELAHRLAGSLQSEEFGLHALDVLELLVRKTNIT